MLVVAAAAGVGVVLYKGIDSNSSAATAPRPAATARAYVAAWKRHQFDAMYRLLAPRSRKQITLAQFQAAYDHAAQVSTLTRVSAVGPTRVIAGVSSTPVVAITRRFGSLPQTMSLHIIAVPAGFRVLWQPQTVFPGLQPGEQLRRVVHAPFARGAIRARDGEILASGPASNREYPQGSAFADITGYVKTPDAEQARQRVKLGWPATRPYGQGGLEESLDSALEGTPTTTLVAKTANSVRTVAVHEGAKPQDVVTTLRVHDQHDAYAALGSRYGGIVVMDPRSGAVRASVGIGMDSTQPPGSSFKTVTAAAALTGKKATLNTVYPYARYIELNGWRLHNYHKESCGGSFLLAFAVSCNSVFAPVADQVGAAQMVAMSKLFGFSRKPTIAYPAATSVVPYVGQLSSDLSLGTMGIGQGGVQATPLQMASVAATIGSQGVYRAPYLVHTPRTIGDHQKDVRIITKGVAADVRTMMEAVVSEGTGRSAALPGVTVAGKTGTAEVGLKKPTDAWFIAFAPADHPTVAVAVLIAGGGVGGEVAAPIAGQVLADALQ